MSEADKTSFPLFETAALASLHVFPPGITWSLWEACVAQQRFQLLFFHHAHRALTGWLTEWLWHPPLSLCQAHLSLHAQSPLPVVPATSHPGAGELTAGGTTADSHGKMCSLFLYVIVAPVAFLFCSSPLTTAWCWASRCRLLCHSGTNTASIQMRFKRGTNVLDTLGVNLER